MRMGMVVLLGAALMTGGIRVAAQATVSGPSEQASESAASAAPSSGADGSQDKGESGAAGGARAFYGSVTDPACPVAYGISAATDYE